jgi:hypothetical protein
MRELGGPMTSSSADRQLDGFIDKFTPEIAAQLRASLAKMRAFLPGAIEMVYDNYSALAIAFSPTERPSDAIFSLAVYPRWVSLFFLRGALMHDPDTLLRGNGKQVRHIVLERGAETLDAPKVRALMIQALAMEASPFDPTRPARVVIKLVSKNQRPRRPAR